MNRFLQFEEGITADDLVIEPRRVSLLARCGPDDRWHESVRQAIDEARHLLSPKARWLSLEDDALDGLFAQETPVAPLVRDGPRWAYVATVGSGLEGKVRTYFDEGCFLEGVLLDAVGSVAVEALSDALQRRCAPVATRFSPGYCSWSLQAQRRLFQLLSPEDLGIRLRPSLLMSPLKSTSGVVVQGEPKVLRVPAATCEQCDARGCTRRRARGPAATVEDFC